jgi:hypothetical protein
MPELGLFDQSHGVRTVLGSQHAIECRGAATALKMPKDDTAGFHMEPRLDFSDDAFAQST